MYLDEAQTELEAAAGQYEQAEERVQTVALEWLRAKVRSQCPQAVFFTLVDSDVHAGLQISEVFDGQGAPVSVDVDDEGVGSWLVEGGYWRSEVVPDRDQRRPQLLRVDPEQWGLRFLFLCSR